MGLAGAGGVDQPLYAGGDVDDVAVSLVESCSSPL
jgi:hypothetical protein